jgi:hypothetical protein
MAAGTLGLEQQDDAALRDPVADLDLQLLDGAGLRCRDVRRRLVGLQRDQRVLDGDLWPTLTCTSMIGTSLKSPMSGTLISTLI